MIIRPLYKEDKAKHNRVVDHPLQLWEWGDFRKDTGVKVKRIGFFEQGELKKSYQITFHDLPLINKTAGYFPRGEVPNDEQLYALRQLAKKENCLFIKLEPNYYLNTNNPETKEILNNFEQQLKEADAVKGRALFAKYSFLLDLSPSLEQLFKDLHSKTRYNVRLAKRKGVEIMVDSTAQGMDDFIKILEITKKRQNFYLHDADYFRKMWQHLSPTGVIKIFKAVYNNEILSVWVAFQYKDMLYYPYGASRNIHRNKMPNNLLMWHLIEYGKKHGASKLDMWGCLGPDADKDNPWYGFHRFKRGYSGDLVEFVGSYDLIGDHALYPIFRTVEKIRWKLLRIKSKIGL